VGDLGHGFISPGVKDAIRIRRFPARVWWEDGKVKMETEIRSGVTRFCEI
jgi:hypothetical protein